MKTVFAAVARVSALSAVMFVGACAAPRPAPSPAPSPTSAPTTESTAAIERLAAALTVMHAEADGAVICPKDTKGLDPTAKQLFPMALAARVRAGFDEVPPSELRAFFTEARLKECTALCRCGTYADFAGTAPMKDRLLDEEKANPRDERAIAACARADAKRVCGSALYRGAAAEARKARRGESK